MPETCAFKLRLPMVRSMRPPCSTAHTLHAYRGACFDCKQVPSVPLAPASRQLAISHPNPLTFLAGGGCTLHPTHQHASLHTLTLEPCNGVFSPDVLICSVGTEIFYNTKSPLVAPLLSSLASPATTGAAGAGTITATTATATTATPTGPIAITVVQPKAAEGKENFNKNLS